MLDRILERLQEQEEEKERLLEHVVVELDKTNFEKALLNRIEEGIWKPSNYKDWRYRIDPARPNLNINRHVHIARHKHIKSKDKHLSWDNCGSRHHPQRFPSKVDKIAKQIARKALDLPDNIHFESLSY